MFTAITEDRPYRSAMSLNEAAETLRSMSANCLLDPDLVEVALANRHQLDRTRQIAQAEAAEQYKAIMAQAV